jgi:hypothetical protein
MFQQFFAREEGKVRDHRLALFHFRLGQFKHVYNAKVNPANFGEIIIEQRDDPVFES